MVEEKTLERFRVAPNTKARLADYDPEWVGTEEMQKLGQEGIRQRALELLEKERGTLAEAQAKLYASDVYAVLMILQGMAGAELEGVIRHVMTGVNPQGCQVRTFSKPSAEELDHDFLWRYSRALPERGRIGIFLPSYYDEVVATRVNPELLARQKLPQFMNHRDTVSTEKDWLTKTSLWKDRYKSINDFEEHLSRNGVVVLKLFLHISKERQKQRFLEMISDPTQRWRSSISFLAERKAWDAYVKAYEETLSATSTKASPWYVIPANHGWAANALAADLLTDVILALGVDYPGVSEEKRKELEEGRRQLENEGFV